MRYQCRLAGKPAFYDSKFPGTYNARRDNLEGFWKSLFGRSHGVMLVNAFYENVARHNVEGRALRAGEKPQNVVLEFKPRPAQDMLVACLWSRWSAPGEPDLLSFAAITDEPPPEVAAAGHDRCIIPIRPENLRCLAEPEPGGPGGAVRDPRRPRAPVLRTSHWPRERARRLVAFNKDQWISSFEDQLSILRPHLTPRVLGTLSLAAWSAHGRKDEEPIETARSLSRSLDQQRPAGGSKR